MRVLKYPLSIITFLFFFVGSYILTRAVTSGQGFYEVIMAKVSYFAVDKEVELTQTGVVEGAVSRESVFAPLTKPIYRNPVRIFSDDFQIDAELVPLGAGASGQLEAPEDWDVAGWYFRSAKAGEEGRVLINGHYDRVGGGPAAFWYLNSSSLGDKVYLVDSSGRHFSYQVSSIFYVSIDDDDRVERALEHEGSSLTLITCSGVWMPSVGTYDNRLVVKADLIE